MRTTIEIEHDKPIEPVGHGDMVHGGNVTAVAFYGALTEKCEWKEDEDLGLWHTGCSKTTGIDTEDFVYCPFCGKERVT